VSRLQTRLERLEQQLPPCRDCAEHPFQVELVSPGEAAIARAQPDPICPSCGEPSERILVLLAFDPDAQAAT
jgi:rubrerythrin